MALNAEIVLHDDHYPGAEGARSHSTKVSKTTLVVAPTTATPTHGAHTPSVVMLASSAVLLPRSRDTEQRARTPLGVQA